MSQNGRMEPAVPSPADSGRAVFLRPGRRVPLDIRPARRPLGSTRGRDARRRRSFRDLGEATRRDLAAAPAIVTAGDADGVDAALAGGRVLASVLDASSQWAGDDSHPVSNAHA
jgi:hypothetical protein